MPLSRQEEWFVPEFSEEEVSIATTEMSTDSRHQNVFTKGSSVQPEKIVQENKNDDDAFVKPKDPVEK